MSGENKNLRGCEGVYYVKTPFGEVKIVSDPHIPKDCIAVFQEDDLMDPRIAYIIGVLAG